MPAPVPGRIEVRIDLPGPLEPAQRLLGVPGINQDAAHIGGVPLVVRIDLDGAPRVLHRLVKGAPQQLHLAQHGVAGAVAVVKFDRPLGEYVGFIQQGAASPPGSSFQRRIAECGQQRVRNGIAGIEFDRLLKQPGGFRRPLRFVPGERVALQYALVGRQARGRLAARAFCVGGLHPADQRADDGLHDAILDGKYLVQPVIEPLGPHMAPALGVDQLRVDADRGRPRAGRCPRR